MVFDGRPSLINNESICSVTNLSAVRSVPAARCGDARDGGYFEPLCEAALRRRVCGDCAGVRRLDREAKRALHERIRVRTVTVAVKLDNHPRAVCTLVQSLFDAREKTEAVALY